MSKSLVYDLPTRVFHWLFSIIFLTAFVIAKTVDDESVTFSYHMLAGLTLSFVVLLRIIWGFWGTKHARFSGFAFKPSDLISYLKGILTNDKRKWAGHNPASSWAAIIMMALALGLGLTGFLMASGNKEAFEDVHELLANSFIIIVILHVAGIILHTLRHREMIGLSMIDGKKQDIATDMSIASSKSMAGILFIGLVVSMGLYIFKSFDSQNRTLHVFGVSLQLGDNESGAESGSENGDKNEGEAKDQDEDEDD